MSGQLYVSVYLVQDGARLMVLLDECPVASLLLLAVASRLAISRIDSSRALVIPRIVAGTFLFGYFLHCFSRESKEFSYLFASLLRAVLGSQVIWSVAAVFTTAVKICMRQLQSMRSRLVSRQRRLAVEAFELQRQRRARQYAREVQLPPPEPPAPRAERLKKVAENANADYEAEVKVLDGLPLDRDEREVLLMRAKQRLLQKLERLGKE